jgi:hypothetical protein
LDFLLQDVDRVGCVEGAALEIEFQSGGVIVIEAEGGEEYEAYSIYLNSGEVVVV